MAFKIKSLSLLLICFFFLSSIFFITSTSTVQAECGWMDIGCQLQAEADGIISAIVKFGGNAILAFFASIVGIAGLFLDFIIRLTIVDMSRILRNSSGLTEAWAFFRDIANMLFIFTLIYLGVLLILNKSEGVKRLVTQVIIAALLINFSLFFTKAAVDISNIFTLQLYSILNPDGQPFSETLFDKLKIVKLYDTEAPQGQDSTLSQETINILAEIGRFITRVVFAVIIMLVAALCFFAFAFLLIQRFLILIYLMVISPLYFLGRAFPLAKSLGSNWPRSLLNQCLFPPIFFALLIAIFFFLTDVAGDQAYSVVTGNNAQATFKDQLGFSLSDTIQYFIIIAAFVGALKLAIKTATEGANGVERSISNFTNQARGWTTRRIGGAVALGGAAVGATAINASNRMGFDLKSSKIAGAAGSLASRAQTASSRALTFAEEKTGVAVQGDLGAGYKGGIATANRISEVTEGTSLKKPLESTKNIYSRLTEPSESAVKAAKADIESVRASQATLDTLDAAQTNLRKNMIAYEQIMNDPKSDPEKKVGAAQALATSRFEVGKAEKAKKKEENEKKRLRAAKSAGAWYKNRAYKKAGEEVLKAATEDKAEQQKQRVGFVNTMLDSILKKPAPSAADFELLKAQIKTLKPEDWPLLDAKEVLTKSFNAPVTVQIDGAEATIPTDIPPVLLFIPATGLDAIKNKGELTDRDILKKLERGLEDVAATPGFARPQIQQYLGNNNKSEWLRR